jgi:hypothetical protein
MNTAIDKRCSRKLEFNLGWSDQTEVSIFSTVLILKEEYLGILSEAYHCFRNLAVQEPSMDMETDTDSIFSSAASVSSASSIESTGSNRSVSRYRQRYGRGGRVYVDRTLTADEKEDLEKTQLKTVLENPIIEERMKFDPRASEDIHVIELDEFSIEYNPVIAQLIIVKLHIERDFSHPVLLNWHLALPSALVPATCLVRS